MTLQHDPRNSTLRGAFSIDDGLNMPNQPGGSELQMCLTPKQWEDRLRANSANKMQRTDSITLLRQMSKIVEKYSDSTVFNGLDPTAKEELDPNVTWPKLLLSLKQAANNLVKYRSAINLQYANNGGAAPLDRIRLAEDILTCTKMLEMEYDLITTDLNGGLLNADGVARSKKVLLTHVNLRIQEIDNERRRDKSGKTIS